MHACEGGRTIRFLNTVRFFCMCMYSYTYFTCGHQFILLSHPTLSLVGLTFYWPQVGAIFFTSRDSFPISNATVHHLHETASISGYSYVSLHMKTKIELSSTRIPRNFWPGMTMFVFPCCVLGSFDAKVPCIGNRGG